MLHDLGLEFEDYPNEEKVKKKIRGKEYDLQNSTGHFTKQKHMLTY